MEAATGRVTFFFFYHLNSLLKSLCSSVSSSVKGRHVCVRKLLPLSWQLCPVGSFTGVSYRYGHYQGILHVLLNEAKLSTFIVQSIPYLAFGRCQCTSMFYDTISYVS